MLAGTIEQSGTYAIATDESEQRRKKVSPLTIRITISSIVLIYTDIVSYFIEK